MYVLLGIGMQVSGIGQPLEDITGQLIMSFPHGAEGHVAAHSVPSVPVTPKKYDIYYNKQNLANQLMDVISKVHLKKRNASL